MKDSRFIELLNLYVDHQISAADAALLEAEIQKKPERRQVYRQYCQMQKACVMLADNFRTQAPAGGQIAEFAPSRRRMATVVYASGLFAAAACVALVLVNRNRLDERGAAPTSPSASVALAVQTATPAPHAPSVAPAPNRVVLQPAFNGLMRDGTTIDTSFVSSDRVPMDWMTRVQFDRVPAEELWFSNPPTMQPEDLMFRNRRPLQGQTEMAAIRFVK